MFINVIARFFYNFNIFLFKKKQFDCFNVFKNGMYKGKKEINDLLKCKYMVIKLYRGIV